MKTKEERLREIMECMKKLFEIGIDMKHESIISFKKISNDFVQNETNMSGKLHLSEYDRTLVYKLSNTRQSVIKLEHSINERV
tara:strand:- start:12274 stop:12522 length:249 start_codon:yes stop_codon:yes gene_type:complete